MIDRARAADWTRGFSLDWVEVIIAPVFLLVPKSISPRSAYHHHLNALRTVPSQAFAVRVVSI
jgi:hypothetical protein